MIAVRIFGILYPVLIFLAISYLGMKAAAIFMVISGAALGIMTKSLTASEQSLSRHSKKNQYYLTAIFMVTIGSCAWYFNSQRMLLLYPVLVNLALFFLFFGSLYGKRTVVERFARFRTPDLTEEAVTYTRIVTKCWSIFFVVNGSIAYVTGHYFSLDVWVLYNGFIAYIFMGLLFGIEFLVRMRVMGSAHDA
jgi:uncharacterized membrane protein